MIFRVIFWLGRLMEDLEKGTVRSKEHELRDVLKDLSSKDVVRHREVEVYRESMSQ